jgi:hypothetical protein
MDTTTETKVKQSAISKLIKAGSKQITISDIIALNEIYESFNVSNIQTLIYTTAKELSEKSAKEIILRCVKQSLLFAQSEEYYDECRFTLNQATEQVKQYAADKDKLYKEIHLRDELLESYVSDIVTYKDVTKHLKIALGIAIIGVIIAIIAGIII